MKRMLRQQLAAMIIGMAALGPADAETRLPDPVAFTNTIELGDLAQAEKWLDAGLPPGFVGSRIGSGLMIAAWEGKLDLMALFVARGADLNQVNANGETAIALAAWRGQLDAVKWLVEHGAPVNAPPRKWSALHYAVFGGHQAVVDYLIGQGADINAQSTNGSTVLMMAIYEGHQELARQLIDKGADPRPKNDWGDGALAWAMRHNQLDIARRVSSAEEFANAVSLPRESWGEPQRSRAMSKELEELLNICEKLAERGMVTDLIDRRIAAERVRIVRAEMDRATPPVRAATLEITASRKKPQEQSANIVYGADGKPAGYKVPPATFTGQARMPPKGKVKNF